jgi:tripartite-type tricarboxylate transporter receptor subunit TctC
MTADRRRRRLVFAATAAAAAASPFAVLPARAQSWPSRQIRIVCPFPPGGLTDLYSRAIGEQLQQNLGQPVLVENKPGAGGLIGNDSVAKAAPDGHTLLVTIQTTLVQAQVLYKKLPYNPERDFTWISALGAGHLPFAVPSAMPVRTFRDFVEFAKSNRTSFGTYSAGSYPHMVAGQLNKLYGTKIEAVHYKGEAPMWLDLAGGQIQGAIGSMAAMLPHVQKGSVRPVAVPTGVRSPKLPDVPTFIEQGFTEPVFALSGWIGLLGPAKLPSEIVERLSKLVIAAGDGARLKQVYETFGITERPTTPEEFLRLYRTEGQQWIAIARDLGITLD